MIKPPRGRAARVFGIVAVIAVAAGIWALVQRQHSFAIDPAAERNVLLITIDTLRADALGSYGGGASTPNLDRLAASGARFTFAHSHAVVTLPSHASILSGRYPYEHGIRDNTGYRFNPAMPTMATMLKRAGFATGAFIAGFPLDRRFGLSTGFDVYDDRLDPESAVDTGERERRADAVVRAASDWIRGRSGKWFGWVHLYDPHVVYAPPPEWAARYPGSPYLGEVAWTDAALGPLFELIAAQPRNTLVIVTSDHGEGLGDHGEQTHGIFAYEAMLRVPLIIAESGNASREPLVVTTPARHVDLLPTVLEAAGTQVPALPGASLLPVIASGGGDDRPSYFEAMTPAVARGWAPLRGVLAGNEKYIDLPLPELYDLAADPRETENLAARRQDRAQVLLNLLKGFNVDPPARAAAETPETLERLRSLGYIGGATAAVRERYTEADDPKRLIALEQMLQRASEAQQQGRLDEAIGLLRDVIARRPDTEDAYRKLALVYWRQGNAKDAIATLEQALRSGVTQSEVRIKLGQYLAESGQPQRAIDLLETTAGSDPDALVTLGNAYMLASRTNDAIATYRRLLDVDPSNAIAYENIGAAELRAGDARAAEQSLRRAISLDPNRAGAHTALGVALASTGRRAEAIDEWRKAITLDPTELNALYNVTINLAQTGRIEEAREFGRRFLAIAPAYMARDAAVIRGIVGG